MRGMPLQAKLLLGLVLIAALLLAVLVGFVAPATLRAFEQRSESIVQRMSTAMEQLASRDNEASRDVLVALVDHTTDARSRMLEDLPVGIYGGDIDRIRQAILDADTVRREQLRSNARVLGSEMEARAASQIRAELERIRTEQQLLNRALSEELRAQNLVLVGAVLAASLLVLGLGLYQFVVRPARALRTATRLVASGDLQVPPLGAGGDELGQLAADFGTMVTQLHEARAELTRLNRSLEDEVARKTAHLEQALADLRATHEQLLQAGKMASIGTLAGGIAHEFHNLIGGIRGCTAEVLAQEQDPLRRETLQVVLRAADRATGIVRQLQRFSRRSVDRIDDVDAATVLDDACRLVEPEARRRGVAVVREYAQGLRLRGDGDALHQVFVNLFTNALQAMPRGGTLTVRGRVEGDHVLLAVVDTGTGIDPADLPRVFEPFFTRRDQGAAGAEPGSGLGLSVSYGIVTAHGGAMSVQSTRGTGTTFTLLLPVRGPGAAPTTP